MCPQLSHSLIYTHATTMSLSSIFSLRKKSLRLTEPTTTLKGQYLGNVSTNVAKGETCIDRPLALLWANFVKTTGKQSVPMKITVDNSGLKVYTANQGLTHYWCHRISHFSVPKSNEKMFVWIYRHVGKRLKVELRCHAILLSSEKKAKSLVEMLNEKVAASLQEYRREKALKHRRRLLHEKAAAHLSQHGESPGQTRTKLLATSKNYKPPTEYSLSSPKLTSISEEVDCSSDEEIPGSAHSTLGRWTLKSRLTNAHGPPDVPDVNMNQLLDNGECENIDYSELSGFATLPRQLRPNSKRRLQKQMLVDRLETLVMSNSPHNQLDLHVADSEDDYEIEAGSEDESDSGMGLPSLTETDGEVDANLKPPNGCVQLESETKVDGSAVKEDIGPVTRVEASKTASSPLADKMADKRQGHSPHIAHIRSFSEGFYSFDKSSLSSGDSQLSLEQHNADQKSDDNEMSEMTSHHHNGLPLMPANSSSSSTANSNNTSFSNVDIESECRAFPIVTNGVSERSVDDLTQRIQTINLTSGCSHVTGATEATNVLSLNIVNSHSTREKISSPIKNALGSSIFYSPGNEKVLSMNEQKLYGTDPSSNLTSTYSTASDYCESTRANSGTLNSDKGFESDCSDSSVEVIRIITKL